MAWYNVSYLRKKQIVIDHTKVSGGSDLSSFPVLISRIDPDLKTVTNGGSVQNANGYDIIFVDASETTKLDHEIEQYVNSTGEIEMHVRIPTLSCTSNIIIYMYYDNASISTSQENVTGVWDANYVAVYHMNNNTGAANSIKDSTSNANNGTPYTTYNTATGNLYTSSGQIAGAQSFNGNNPGASIQAPSTSSLNVGTTNTMTMSLWVQRNAANTVGDLISHSNTGVGGYLLALGISPATTNQIKITKPHVNDITLGTFPADTNWHYVMGSGDANGTYVDIDGTRSTSSNTQNWLTDAVPLEIGSGISTYFHGCIDEVRISNIARSQGWGITEYNNQSSPSTFYSVGPSISVLSVFLSSEAATTVSTANKLYTISGSPGTTHSNSLLNRVTGWGEVYSQGNASAWAGGATKPSPDGNGWILDSSVLEGQQFVAGRWSGTLVFVMNSFSVTFSELHVRMSKRSASGSYTTIFDTYASNASISNSNFTLTISPTPAAAIAFGSGDKLYFDIVGNISTPPTISGFSLEILNLSTDTTNKTGSVNAEIISPGYVPWVAPLMSPFYALPAVASSSPSNVPVYGDSMNPGWKL